MFALSGVVASAPATPTAAVGQGVAAATSTVSVAAPSGSGGKLYAVCMSNTTGQTWTAPDGTWASTFTESGLSVAVFEQATPGAGPFTFTRSATSTGALAIAVRVTGAGTFQIGDADSTTGDLTLSSVTTTGSNILLLQVVARIVVAAVTWTPPGGTTSLIDGTTAGSAYEYAVGYDVVGAGATGTRLWDQSGTGGATKGVVLAINPA